MLDLRLFERSYQGRPRIGKSFARNLLSLNFGAGVTEVVFQTNVLA